MINLRELRRGYTNPKQSISINNPQVVTNYKTINLRELRRGYTIPKQSTSINNSQVATTYKIIISTIASYGVAYTQLRKSLTDAGISDNDIITVYANSTEDTVTGNIITIKNNIYEYTAFLGMYLLDAPPDTAFLLLHDTCEVGPAFKSRLERMVKKHKQGSITWASSNGQCNLGIFSPNVVSQIYSNYSSLMTMSKMDSIYIEWNTHPLSLKRIPVIQHYDSNNAINCGSVYVYNNNTKRVKLYFNSLDITKYYVHVNTEKDHPLAP